MSDIVRFIRRRRGVTVAGAVSVAVAGVHSTFGGRKRDVGETKLLAWMRADVVPLGWSVIR